jgi:hypothetical protein
VQRYQAQKLELGEEVGPLAYAEEFELMKDIENMVEFKDSVRALILENHYARILFRVLFLWVRLINGGESRIPQAGTL